MKHEMDAQLVTRRIFAVAFLLVGSIGIIGGTVALIHAIPAESMSGGKWLAIVMADLTFGAIVLFGTWDMWLAANDSAQKRNERRRQQQCNEE
jgi:hypothetical protein